MYGNKNKSCENNRTLRLRTRGVRQGTDVTETKTLAGYHRHIIYGGDGESV